MPIRPEGIPLGKGSLRGGPLERHPPPKESFGQRSLRYLWERDVPKELHQRIPKYLE